MKSFLLPLLLPLALLHAEEDPWDQPPLNYSATAPANELTLLAGAQPPALPAELPPLDRLRRLLGILKIPVESQILVFSKTSFQNPLIRPENPRSLYFSENGYVGYVPGGALEAIVHDPVLGPVFYHIDAAGTIARDRSDCLSCHATARTEGMPGLLVRSVFPRADGQPLLEFGSQTVNHATPLEKRWGGYYVTGRSSLPHLGNRTFTSGETPAAAPGVLPELSGVIDTSRYLLPTSDVTALLVLEHQCRMHNLLHTASAQYQRTCYLSRLASPDSDPDQGAGGRLADQMADRILECLLFKDEAPLDGEVEGSGTFEQAFTARYPRTPDGHSLAEFQMNTRIFKYRCSYMIYSRAFASLPPRVKQAVLTRLHTILSGNEPPPAYAYLKTPERQRIAEILAATLPEWTPGK